MKPRDDIDADVISLIGEPHEIRMAGLLQIQIFLLADIRDLLLASEQRTQQFTQELERLRRPAGSTLNVEALRTIPEGDPYWRVDKFDDED